MTKKFQSIINKCAPVFSLIVIGIFWLTVSEGGLIPNYMLPSPLEVVKAFISEFPILAEHSAVTLQEALYGLLLGTGLGFIFAVLMDRFGFLYKALYPILVVSQTIPTIAIAPVLVLWMGFSMAPKITLVVLTTFFPITVSLLDGFKSVSADEINLLRSMGANDFKIFRHIKFPASLEQFFSGLKVSASYAVVGAVISEWLGGFEGLGVYMTRVKKAYAFDKMFAVIILISAVSLLLMGAVALLKWLSMPHKRKKQQIKKEMIIMKKIFAVLLTLVFLFSLTACSGKVDDGLTELVLCLDWTPNTNHTGFYVADALGYYEEEGIKIKIVQPPEDGAEIMTASGQAQFGISFQDSLAAAFALEEPLEITAVAAVLQHNTSGIISRKGEGTDTPKGLENKRYSTWNSPIELKMVEHLMKKSGADYEKLQLVPSVTNEAEALRNGDADAIWIYYGWAGIACEVADVDFDYFNMTDMEKTFDYYTPVIIANNLFLEQNPEEARAFLRATEKGYRYAVENPEAAAAILIKGDTTGSLIGSEELVTESQKWMASQYIADSEKWGYMEPERWNGFYEWLYEEGLLDRDITGKGFSNNYLG